MNSAKMLSSNNNSNPTAEKVIDFSNDPVFIKKGLESRAFLEKNGFPKELLQIRDQQAAINKTT